MKTKLILITATLFLGGIFQSCEKDLIGTDVESNSEFEQQFLSNTVATQHLLNKESSQRDLENDQKHQKKIRQSGKKYQTELREKTNGLLTSHKAKIASNSESNFFKKKSGLIKVPWDYPTLQGALDAATPGTEILVSGNLMDQGVLFVFTPGISIKGANNASVQGDAMVVDANDLSLKNIALYLNLVLTPEADGVEITNASVSSSDFLAVDMFDVSDAKFINSSFYGEMFGVMVTAGGNNTFTNCQFSNSSTGYNPIFVDESVGNAFKNCTADGAGAPEGRGFWVAARSDGNRFENCKAFGHGIAGFVNVASDNTTFLNCQSYDNTRGWQVYGGNHNVLDKCKANGNSLNGIVISANAGEPSLNAVLDKCHASSNGSVGIYINFNTTTTVTKCHANQNGFYGILDVFGFQNHISSSHANNNGDTGIYLYESEEDTVDKCHAIDNEVCDFKIEFGGNHSLNGNHFENDCSAI